MTRTEEMELIRELGDLQRNYNLTDKSEENKARGKRIIEIRTMLNLIQQPRKNYRKAKVINR